MYYTKKDLIGHIKALGIEDGDTVMVHTSLKSVGKIDGEGRTTAEVYIDALRECLGSGLLLIPSHTWATITESGQIFDVRKSMPCIGAVPTEAVLIADADAEHKTVLRSLHPTHSVVAFGRNAAEYVEDDERATTPTPWTGSFGKLYSSAGKIMLVGVGHERNTYFHAVDEWLDIAGRLSEYPLKVQTRGYDGELCDRSVHTHRDSVSDYFPNYEPSLDWAGAVTYGRLGNALARVCDAVKCADEIKRLWANASSDLCDREKRID